MLVVLDQLPHRVVTVTASWILHAEIQHRRANALKLPSTERAENITAVCLVTTAILPAFFGVFAHGAFLVAHSLSELTSGCNWDARFLEITPPPDHMPGDVVPSEAEVVAV